MPQRLIPQRWLRLPASVDVGLWSFRCDLHDPLKVIGHPRQPLSWLRMALAWLCVAVTTGALSVTRLAVVVTLDGLPVTGNAFTD